MLLGCPTESSSSWTMGIVVMVLNLRVHRSPAIQHTLPSTAAARSQSSPCPAGL